MDEYFGNNTCGQLTEKRRPQSCDSTSTVINVIDCNTVNAHERDCLLSFDAPSHTYRLGNRTMKSVTTIVEECFPKFDAEYWASRKARSDAERIEILQRWEAEARKARQLGTTMHEHIERYYLDQSMGKEPVCPAEGHDSYRLFYSFARANTLHPFRTEWRIFHEEYGVAGTLDFLERTPQNTYIIYDWKRSKKLIDERGNIIDRSRYGAIGLGPVRHLPDTSYWHYALQLSIYRLILEEKYGINVSDMRLGVFHPHYSRGYLIRHVPYLRKEALDVLLHCGNN